MSEVPHRLARRVRRGHAYKAELRQLAEDGRRERLDGLPDLGIGCDPLLGPGADGELNVCKHRDAYSAMCARRAIRPFEVAERAVRCDRGFDPRPLRQLRRAGPGASASRDRRFQRARSRQCARLSGNGRCSVHVGHSTGQADGARPGGILQPLLLQPGELGHHQPTLLREGRLFATYRRMRTGSSPPT